MTELQIILSKLESIERRLDVLIVPVVAEEARQIVHADPATLRAYNKEVRRRAKENAKGRTA